jgi:uncharacterized protein DUF4339
MAACKVRLADGSEVGPLDSTALREWYDQGLIDNDTPALAEGTRNWGPLSKVVDTSTWRQDLTRRPAASRGRAAEPERERGGRGRAEQVESSAGSTGRWRSILAGALLLAGAGLAGFLYFRPELWTKHLAEAPWREIALGLLAVGLLLLPGWSWGRRIARLASVLASIGALAWMGPVVAQGSDRTALLILAVTAVLAFALSIFLSPSLSILASIVSLLVILAAGYGIGYLGYVPPGLPQPPPARATQ